MISTQRQRSQNMNLIGPSYTSYNRHLSGRFARVLAQDYNLAEFAHSEQVWVGLSSELKGIIHGLQIASIGNFYHFFQNMGTSTISHCGV